MANIDLGSALRVPGKICINPGSVTSDWPHGGTGLGLTKNFFVKPRRRMLPIREESFGIEIVDFVNAGEAWLLSFELRGMDSDAINNVFSKTVAGSNSGSNGVAYPSDATSSLFYPGGLASSGTVKVLFTPDDIDRHYFVYFPKCVLFVDEEATINMDLEQETVIHVMGVALRDSNALARAALIQKREDLTI